MAAVRFEVPGKDPIDVARLPGGGAIITYVKQEAGEQHEEPGKKRAGEGEGQGEPRREPSPRLRFVYVHTLNTESGFLRKAEALGLDLATIFAASASSSSSDSSFSCAAAECTVRILGFLLDGEKNACAYSLVRRFRRLPP